MKYGNIIDTFTWSYSRIKAFSQCKYGFLLKYIYLDNHDKPHNFFSEYGSFVHSLLEKYYSGKVAWGDLALLYMTGFYNNVIGQAPNSSMFNLYYTKGLSYFESCEPRKENVLGVEKKFEFVIDGIPFVGFADYISEYDGDLYITDHKSHDLKQRSEGKRKKKSDEELDEYLKQLYLYCVPIKEEFGKYPDVMRFNCYRNGNIIEEKFTESGLANSREWVLSEIDRIYDEDKWEPSPDYFFCRYLCDCRDQCEYYNMSK